MYDSDQLSGILLPNHWRCAPCRLYGQRLRLSICTERFFGSPDVFCLVNPLEKEFLIRQYKSNTRIKMRDFCEANHISTGAFQKWIKQYDEGGLEGLARADSEIKDVLPEGIDRTEESYKREILKLRIENERLKKNYVVQTTDTGEQEFIRLRPKNSKS